MSPVQTLFTAQEYELLPVVDRFTELVRGQIIEIAMPGALHGITCVNVAFFLRMYKEQHDCGHVFANDTWIVTQHDPDTVRGADMGFITYDRLPKGSAPMGSLRVPPNLIFEIRSPTDRWKDILEKITEYFKCGVDYVCIADPQREIVRAYTPDEPDTELHGDDLLEFPHLLPGFSVPVRRFFE